MGARIDPASLPRVEREFVEKMRGAALVGRFTVAAAKIARRSRIATTSTASTRWATISGGSTRGSASQASTLPIVVTMRFVDDTPLIMMSNATIPGMGTFTVRVFFYGDEYAGTWEHVGRGGGHMFGRIEKGAAQKN